MRHALRSLALSPGFSAAVVLTLALGIGANTAVFSVLRGVLLRPLPFADSDALVRACEGPRTGAGWGCMNELSPANYRDFKAMSSSFEAMGAFTGGAVNLVGIGEPRRLASTRLTPDVPRTRAGCALRQRTSRTWDRGQSSRHPARNTRTTHADRRSHCPDRAVP